MAAKKSSDRYEHMQMVTGSHEDCTQLTL